MKLLLILSLTLCATVHQTLGQSVLTVLKLTPTNYDGCMEAVGDATDNAVILGTCDATKPYQEWVYDIGSNMIRMATNQDKCLQVGYKDREVDAHEDGMMLRIGTCDGSLPRQLFLHLAPDGAIVMNEFQTFCVVFRGTSADLDEDPIILKRCSNVDGKRQGWLPVPVE